VNGQADISGAHAVSNIEPTLPRSPPQFIIDLSRNVSYHFFKAEFRMSRIPWQLALAERLFALHL